MNRYVNDVVVEAYSTHLRRAPDVEGFAFWVNAVTNWLKEGKIPSEIESELKKYMTDSEEYKAYTVL